jgi:membrane protease YdiL (CAAX protease family)
VEAGNDSHEGGGFIGPDGRLRSGWRVVAFLLVFVLVVHVALPIPIVVVVAVFGALTRGPHALQGFLTEVTRGGVFQQTMALFMTPATLLLIWPFRRWLDRRSYRSLGFWLDGRTAIDLFLGLVAGAALVMVMAGSALLAGMYEWGGISPPGGGLAGRMLLALFGLGAAALLEEVVFRAYVQNNLTESVGPVWAIALAGLGFAIMHCANPNVTLLAGINLFLAGVLLGLVYHRFRSIWAAWSMHFAWNFTMGPLLGVPVSGLKMASLMRMSPADPLTAESTDWWVLTGGPFGFEGGLAATAVMALFIAGLGLAWRGRPPRPVEPLTTGSSTFNVGSSTSGTGPAGTGPDVER